MASRHITHADIIGAAAAQLDEYSEALDMVQAVKGGVPSLEGYYREQIQAIRDSLHELAEVMRADAKAVSD